MRLQYLLILLRLIHLEVIEEFSPLRHFPKKPASRRVVFLVLLEMLRQQSDFFCVNGDLHLRGTGIFGMGSVLRNEIFLLSTLDRHGGGGQRKERAEPPKRAIAEGSADGELFYVRRGKKQGKIEDTNRYK